MYKMATHASMPPCTLILHGLSVTLEASRVEAIVTVPELYYTANRITHGGVVVRDEILQRLHEAALHVPSFSSLDGGIDQTFTTRDGVEQEFCGGEPSVETIPDKSLRWRISRLLGEVRQRAVLKAIGYTMSSDDLLPDTGHHL